MGSAAPVLLVDDDPDILSGYRLMLEECGFTVFTAEDSQAALRILENETVAACLVDLRLKDEDGLAVAQDLYRADPLLKVFILTAHPSYDTAVQAMKAGIHDYISKLESPGTIIAKLTRALEDREREIASRAAAAGNATRLVLLCEHDLVRAGIDHFCGRVPGFTLVHHCRSIRHLKLVPAVPSAEVVLLCADCLLPGGTEPAHLGAVQGQFPGAALLLINCELPNEARVPLLTLGVRGFLGNNCSLETIEAALVAVRQGRHWLSPEVASLALSALLPGSARPAPVREGLEELLSRRELEILSAMTAGLSNQGIAHQLFISESTVKIHVNHIFKKLDVKSRTQAVMKALALGGLPPREAFRPS